MKGTEEGTRNTQPADGAISIADNAFAHLETRAVYIGAAKDYDFYMNTTPNLSSGEASNGTIANYTYAWVAFKGCAAGTVLPIQVKGVRINSTNVAPTAGDIVFLY